MFFFDNFYKHMTIHFLSNKKSFVLECENQMKES